MSLSTSRLTTVLTVAALCTIAASRMAAQSATGVSPVPPPTPPSGPVVVRTDNALDGRGNVLRAHRIGIANGRITSLTAPARGTVIDLRGYTVMPGWIDTHVHLDSHWN